MVNSLINKTKTCLEAYDIFISDLPRNKNTRVVNFLKDAYLIQTAKSLIEIAWKELGKDPARLSLEKETVKIPIKKELKVLK